MSEDSSRPTLHTETQFSHTIMELLGRIASSFGDLKQPVKAFIAGGAAVHLYTGHRVSEDLDVEFSRRVIVPSDLVIAYIDETGAERAVIFDTNYNSTLALMDEGYIEHAHLIGTPNGDGRMEVYVLSAIDLAISKLSRFADNDRGDIAALAREGLIGSTELEQKANDALGGYVGGIEMVKLNIRDAVKMVREIEQNREQTNERNGPSNDDTTIRP